jgi:dephospho-CoA kinase
MNPFTIGLTGGIGSGKSTVTELFRQKQIDIIDADVVARTVVQPHSKTLHLIAAELGNEVLNEDDSLNRAYLKDLVFQHPEIKAWLENLLHPLIRTQMQEQLAHTTSAYVILAIPLLIETLPNPLVRRILLVDCPEACQIERTISRDHISPDLVQNIINQQSPREERRQYADDIIENDDTLQALEIQVDDLHQFYLDLAK